MTCERRPVCADCVEMSRSTQIKTEQATVTKSNLAQSFIEFKYRTTPTTSTFLMACTLLPLEVFPRCFEALAVSL